jgi:hypothetical protein
LPNDSRLSSNRYVKLTGPRTMSSCSDIGRATNNVDTLSLWVNRSGPGSSIRKPGWRRAWCGRCEFGVDEGFAFGDTPGEDDRSVEGAALGDEIGALVGVPLTSSVSSIMRFCDVPCSKIHRLR